MRFQKKIENRRIEVVKSLQTHDKIVALTRKKFIDKRIELEDLDPFDPDFEIEFEKPKPRIIFVNESIALFLESRKTCRQATQDYYEILLNHFAQYLGIKKKRISSLQQAHFEKFLARENIKNATRHSEKKGLRTWCRWCQSHEWVEKDIVKPIKLPEAEIFYEPKMITEQKLFNVFKKFDEHLKKRRREKNFSPWQTQDWFKAAIATIFYTGIRRREIGKVDNAPGSGLKGQNIKGNLDFIYIGKSKTSKERYIPISQKLKPFLIKYFEKRGWPEPDEYVFINYKGQPVMGKTMYKQFKEYCKLAKIPKTKSLHGMRHRRATTWLEEGWTLSEVKDMLGHTHIEMTDKIYTHLAAKNLKRKMDRIEAEKNK